MFKNVVRATAMLALVPAVAAAQASIVIPGVNATQSWGQPGFYTDIFGQTFRAPDATNTSLTSFTFYLIPDVGQPSFTPPIPPAPPAVGTFQAAVYQWNGTTAVGSALFLSSVMTIPGATAAGTPVTILTGGTQLTAGLQYVAFFQALAGTTGAVGFNTNFANPYANGAIVYATGGPTGSWGTFSNSDFRANFQFVPGTTSVVPEPSGLALVATGLVGFGGIARRRRSRR